MSALSLDIFFDNFLVPSSTNAVDVIPACPKLSAPQLLPYLRMPSKYLFRRYTLRYFYSFFRRHHWYALQQKMHVISVTPHLNIINFISLCYPFAYLSQTLFYCFGKNFSPILGRTDQMIQQQILVMTLDNMLCHGAYCNPAAELRGIL